MGLSLGLGLGVSQGRQGATKPRVIWEANFSTLTPGSTVDPAGVSYARASSATTIHPLVSGPLASGFSTNQARIVATTTGQTGLLVEGAATNEHASDTPWTWSGTPSAGSSTSQDTSTADVAGVMSCALHAVLSGGFGRYDSASNAFPADVLGDVITVSHYVRGSGVYQPNNYDGQIAHCSFSTLAGGTIWERKVQTYPAAGRTRSIMPADGRDETAAGGTTAGARNYRTCRHQVERSCRASSWIAPATTRAGARCRIGDLAAVTPDGRLRLEIAFVALHDATKLPWSPRLWTIDSTNYAEIDRFARCVRVVVGGVAAWVSAPITWAAGDLVVLRLDVGGGATQGSVQVGGGRVATINDARELAPVPLSGTIDIACNGTGAQLEGVHLYWRAFDRSPTQRTIVASTVEELLAALPRAGDRTRLLLRGGTYRITGPIQLTATNSGLAIASYPGEAAVIDGGELIAGPWSSPNGSGVRTTSFTGHSLQLWVKGAPAERARSSYSPAGWSWNGDGTVTAPSSAEAAKVGVDGVIVARRLWRTFRMRVASRAGATLTIQPSDFADATTLDPSFGPNAVWFVEGLGYVGDAEGYFWHDRGAGVLHYKPRTGQDLSTDEIVAGKADRLITAIGSLGAPIRDVTISGIALRHSTWTDPDDHGASALQGSILVRAGGAGENGTDYDKIPGAVMARAADRFLITGCELFGIGSDGVSLRVGTTSSAVVDCDLDDIAGTALSSGNVTSFIEDPHPSDARAILANNVFANNNIGAIATLYRSSHAVWAVWNRGLVVARNRISTTPYTPIAIGWGWGASDAGGVVYNGSPSGWPLGVTPASPNETPAGATLIAANYVEGYLRDLDDGGALYTIGDLGNGGETLLLENYVAKSSSSANQSGLYLDQASEHITVRRCVFDTQGAAWAKVQASITPYAIACTIIGNYADAGAISNGPGNTIASNTVGALGAVALAIKAAAGRIT